MCKKDYFKNGALIFFLLILTTNTIGCGIMGPVVTYRICSIPAWIPGSDKIAYFEIVTYGIDKIETEDVYKIKLVLNIKSLSNPLFHKKIVWTNPNLDLSGQIHLSFSPKGDKIIFSIGQDEIAYKKGKIFIASISKKNEFQKIIDNGLNPEWSPSGDLIIYQGINQNGFFTTDDGKFGINRNSTNWDKENEFLMTDTTINQITPIMLLIGEKPKWSSDGNKIIFSASDRIFISDKYGKRIQQIKIPYKEVGAPALSPDMTKVVFCKYRKGYHWFETNLYIADVLTGIIEKEIIEPNGPPINKHYDTLSNPVWSPNGEYIAYICSKGIFVIKKDGTGLKLIDSGYHRRPGW